MNSPLVCPAYTKIHVEEGFTAYDYTEEKVRDLAGLYTAAAGRQVGVGGGGLFLDFLGLSAFNLGPIQP